MSSTIETTLNQALDVIAVIPVVGTTIPPLNTNVTGLLATAAAGQPVSLSAIASDGSLIGPSDECNATADSYTLDREAGIAIGGNAITGLGLRGQLAQAGELNSLAIGNGARTDVTATGSIAIGTDASVGALASSSLALGRGASALSANSLALGAGSLANRGAMTGYSAFGLGTPQNSAGTVSIGSTGAERQITNLAAGSAPTDAVNVAQLQAVAALIGSSGGQNAVVYDSTAFTSVTLAGAGGTTITNVAPGALNAGSSDAVNGSQLFATNQQVSSNTTAITNLTTIVTSGGNAPVQYSNEASPTVPNGGVPTNDATLVGASPGAVQLHNVDAGTQATDAVNLAQLQAVASRIGGSTSNAVTYNDSTLQVVTLAGAGGTTINNVAAGALTSASTDAVNGSQLYATNQNVAINATAISNLSTSVANGGIGPVQYSNADNPTVPNGGVQTNHVTLVGSEPGPVQVHNVAEGRIEAGSTDAVNGGQIRELADAVENAVTYQVDARGARTNTVVLAGGNLTQAVAIRNVAAGVDATDAVNVRQLDVGVSRAIEIANAYTDARLEALNFDLRRNRRAAEAGTAAALAAAGLPQPIERGKGMIAVGAGAYGSRLAIAVGASAASDDGKTVVKFGVTYNSSDRIGANAGLGFQF